MLAVKYEILVERINKVDIPNEAAQAHQSLAAAYGAYGAALRGLTEIGVDRTIPPAAFQQYSDAAVALGKAFIESVQFFAERGVRFAQDEPGNIFALP